MSYNQYLDYAKAGGFQALSESAFNSLINAGFTFTSSGLSIK
jgi:hypothetical protein